MSLQYLRIGDKVFVNAPYSVYHNRFAKVVAIMGANSVLLSVADTFYPLMFKRSELRAY